MLNAHRLHKVFFYRSLNTDIETVRQKIFFKNEIKTKKQFNVTLRKRIYLYFGEQYPVAVPQVMKHECSVLPSFTAINGLNAGKFL